MDLHPYAGPALALNRPGTVEGCTFAELESTGIAYGYDAQPFTIRESVFRDVRNIAVSGWGNATGPAGSLIERNLFIRIGAERGYGGSGSWHAAGVILGQANQALVRLNRFVDTGYAGIILGSDGQTVEQNVFVRTMKTLNDGAAVYTNCNASIIRQNIILDTIGDLSTSQPWWPLGHGIWLEFLEQFRDSQVIDNTIYGSNGSGIFLPNNFSCTVSGNHVVDNRVAGLDLSVDTDTNQNHQLTENTLAAVAPTRRVTLPENLSEWLLPPYTEDDPVALSYQATGDYGTMTGTTLIAAETGAGVIRADDTEMSTLSEWTAAAPWASDEGSLVVRANAILLFNDTESSVNMAVPAGSWTNPDGSVVDSTIALEPFTSAVLVTTDAVESTPPYYAASGIDWRAEEPVTQPLLPGGGGEGVGGAPGAGGANPNAGGRVGAGGRTGAGGDVGEAGGGDTPSEAGAAGTGDPGAAGRGGTPPGTSGGSSARGGSGSGSGGRTSAAAGDGQTGEDAGSPGIAGNTGNSRAGAAGEEPGGGANADDDSGGDSGCGCRVAGTGAPSAPSWAGLALFVLALCRRNRRRTGGINPG